MSITISLPVACSETGSPRVYRVIDGDTILVSGGEYIRYIGIDSPERGEPYYEEATELNRSIVENMPLILEKDVSDEDRYGRKLRYVYVNDIFVNAEIVRQGLAFARSYPPDTKYQPYLEMMESEARINRRGLWHYIR